MSSKETRLYINKQLVRLDPSQLIQSGGEGMVFKVGKTAVKVYHQPQPGQAEKLRMLMDMHCQGEFPANVLGPCALAENDRNEVVGFQMPLLKENSQPVKQLSRPGYWQKVGITTQDVCTLFGQLYEILTRLHQTNTVVGDLNENNIFFNGSDRQGWWQSFWIDVDSYQFGRFPCPVAMQSFLDPNLYSVQDFSLKPVFSPDTDWYAFFVLLVKSLLQVHPYGGTHHEKQTLASRAEAGISILDSTVTYPKRARPIETLSNNIIDHLEQVFEKGARFPFPFFLLEEYAAGLHTCSDCGLTYPQSRPGCPGCRTQTPVLASNRISGRLESIELAVVDGYIIYTKVLPSGQVAAVVRSGIDYHFLQIESDGRTKRLPLFTGQAQYRFDFFDGRYLVVNPVGKTQLLILDVSGPQPAQVTMVPTAAFRGQSVFAATPNHLVRIVQGTIMKGTIRDGSLIEEVVGTARREQTWLWASPLNGNVAGYYRFFDALTLFTLDGDGAYFEIDQPILGSGESLIEIEAAFSQRTTAFFLKINRLGQQYLRSVMVGEGGRLISISEKRSGTAVYYDTVAGKALSDTTVLHPTDDGIIKENGQKETTLTDTADLVTDNDILHGHPDGLVVQQASKLYLLKEIK